MPTRTFAIQYPTTNGDRIGFRYTLRKIIWNYGLILVGLYMYEIYQKGFGGCTSETRFQDNSLGLTSSLPKQWKGDTN